MLLSSAPTFALGFFSLCRGGGEERQLSRHLDLSPTLPLVGKIQVVCCWLVTLGSGLGLGIDFSAHRVGLSAVPGEPQ